MAWLFAFIVMCVCIYEVHPYTIRTDSDDNPTVQTTVIRIFLEGSPADQVYQVHIVDPTNNDPEATPAGCRTGNLTGPLDAANGPSYTYDGTQLLFNGNNEDCAVVAGNPYNVRVRIFTMFPTPTNIDQDFEVINRIGTSRNGVRNTGSLSFPNLPQPQTIVPLVAIHQQISVTLEVSDEFGVAQNNIALGETAKLKFEMTINPFSEGGIEGATLHTCVAADNNMFTSATQFIDPNGCFVSNNLFPNPDPTTGFSRDATDTSANTNGVTKMYVAFSKDFEVGSLTSNGATGSTNTMYIRCQLTTCRDDQTGSSGCAGNHCTPSIGRKRRSDGQRKDTTVTTTITLTNGEKKKCIQCSDTLLYKATIGGLGSIAVALFGVMMFMFFSLERDIKAETKKILDRRAASDRYSVPSTKTSTVKLSHA